MKYKILITILFPFILMSCKGYEKLLKSSDYQLKYDKAFEYYNDGDNVRSATLFEQIATVYRGTSKADTIGYYRAKAYYNQKDYTMAGHYFKELSKTYPKSPFADEADFMSAYCLYMLSPRPELDQSNTYAAINAFNLFLLKHPKSPKADECRSLILEMNEKLVNKSYLSARLYYDLGDYKASIIALRNSLNDYPDTKYREELMFLLLKSSYLLAENSVPSKIKDRYQATIDEYYSFISEFPKGKYVNDAKSMYNASMAFLGEETNQNSIQ
ncbi:MAG: outer membrane protein assembly factor BamD [Bacteroidales bacterium]|nr:outer membrane protein assembly factor BamD [Bacteroidales bacterium]